MVDQIKKVAELRMKGMMEKRMTLKNDEVRLSLFLCIVLFLISISINVNNQNENEVVSFALGNKLIHSSGITIDVAGRLEVEENLSEKIITENEGESLRPLFRYNSVMLIIIGLIASLMPVYTFFASLPVHTFSFSHCYNVVYIHDIDGCKNTPCFVDTCNLLDH